MSWMKASDCGESSHCVEVMWDKTVQKVMVRDSNNPHGGLLVFPINEWDSFIDGAKKGEFDFKETAQ